MKLLEENPKKGIRSLLAENLDDLWHLYNLIETGDLVTARTSREIKAQGDASRPSSGRRIQLTLTLKVTQLAFDKSLSRLRVHGVIVVGPERYEGLLGSHHTLSFAPESKLTIVKEKWSLQHLRRLKDAYETRFPPLTMIAMDDEDVTIGVLGRFGFDVKFEKRVRLPGKRNVDERQGELLRYFAEVAGVLEQVRIQSKGDILLLGPGFIKSDFLSYLRKTHPELGKAIVQVASVGSGGRGGIYEALRRGLHNPVLERSRVIQEMNLVEDLFAELVSGSNRTAYGLGDVEKAAKLGAVNTLLVVDKSLRELEGEERLRLEGTIREVENKRGKIYIISGEHEGGEKILSLGGIAADLRFPIS